MTDDTSRNAEQDQARLRAILENAVDAIITIDETGVIDSVNPAFVKMFQYAPEEMVGKNVKLLMPSPYQEEHDGYIQNYLATGLRKIIGIGREIVGLRKDGTTFPTHLAVSEFEVGNRKMFCGIVRDITDLKEAEEQLERMNEELEERVRQRTAELRAAQAELVAQERLATLGQVSGGIAHEIRNPLNAVKTSAYYLLHAKSPSLEKSREHLERIDRQVTLIDNVITALSDVAKLPEPELKAISVKNLLGSVAGEVSLPNNIQVDVQVADDIPGVLIDEHQIPIVLRNLIRNARDAMPDGGRLVLSAERRDGDVAISVADTGVGIAAGDVERVMEPLFSTKTRGMGLGLAICKAIVERNGGALSLTSELGIGSTFVVELKAHDQ